MNQDKKDSDNRQSHASAQKVAYLGLLTAAAMILSYVESLFPVFAVPGMKLGLPNVAIVMVLYLYGWKEAVLVSVVRLLGVALLFGNTFSFLFSLSGAALSLLCMILAKKSGKLDTLGVSMIGGVTHNAGQIIAAIFLVENVRVGYYFFILAISGVIAGLVIGVIAGEMVKRMQKAIRKAHR